QPHRLALRRELEIDDSHFQVQTVKDRPDPPMQAFLDQARGDRHIQVGTPVDILTVDQRGIAVRPEAVQSEVSGTRNVLLKQGWSRHVRLRVETTRMLDLGGSEKGAGSTYDSLYDHLPVTGC